MKQALWVVLRRGWQIDVNMMGRLMWWALKNRKQVGGRMRLTFSPLLILSYFHLLCTKHWHARAHINCISISLGAAHQWQLKPLISGLCAVLYWDIQWCTLEWCVFSSNSKRKRSSRTSTFKFHIHFCVGWTDVPVYPGKSQFWALCPVSRRI